MRRESYSYFFLICKIRFSNVEGMIIMLNDEICKLRDKLNKSIEDNADYDEIYKISVELDKLIASFYKNSMSQDV